MNEKYNILRSRLVKPVPTLINGISQTSDQIRKIHGIKLGINWYHFNKNGTGTYISPMSDWIKCEEYICSKLINDLKYLDKTYFNQYYYGEQLVSLSKSIMNADLKDKSILNLLKLYEKLIKSWLKIDTLNVPPWFWGGDLFQKNVFEQIKKHDPMICDDELMILATLPEKSFSMDEDLRITKLVLNIKKLNLKKHFITNDNEKLIKLLPQIIIEKIDDLVKKYYWIPYGYDGPNLYDRKYYLNLLKNELKANKNFDEKLIKIQNYEISIRKKQEEIIKKYAIPEYIVNLTKKIHKLSIMTDQRKEFQFQSYIAFDRLFEAISKKLGIEKDVLKYVWYDELKKYYKTPQKLMILYKYRRGNSFFVKFHNGKIRHINDEKEVKELEDSIFEKNQNKVVIKGITASLGRSIGKNHRIIGKIRILFSPKQMHELREGEILVTHMTTPEYVPAMRKSLAIITDEGGVTCHAAIVSRELEIPCIIGTKNATKILKDRDIVEMDILHSIIKVIGKN